MSDVCGGNNHLCLGQLHAQRRQACRSPDRAQLDLDCTQAYSTEPSLPAQEPARNAAIEIVSVFAMGLCTFTTVLHATELRSHADDQQHDKHTMSNQLEASKPVKFTHDGQADAPGTRAG